MMPLQPVKLGISARDTENALFWDHFTLQQMFREQVQTFIIHETSSPNNPNDPYLRKLQAADHKFTAHLAPVTVGTAEDMDVIVIPGRVNNTEDNRKKFEEKLLLDYYGKKPVILICAGVWRLTALGAVVAHVRSHNNSRMVRLSETGKVTHNTAIHYNEIQANDTARKIWGEFGAKRFEVNSVHDRAVIALGPTLENHLEVVLRSGEPILLKGRFRKNRNQQDIRDTAGVIEAIVTKLGAVSAPLVAVQYHPEAYCQEKNDVKKFHKALLAYAVDYVHNARKTEPENPITNGQLLMIPRPRLQAQPALGALQRNFIAFPDIPKLMARLKNTTKPKKPTKPKKQVNQRAPDTTTECPEEKRTRKKYVYPYGTRYKWTCCGSQKKVVHP